MVSTLNLIRTAGLGGVVVSSTGFYLQHKLKERVRTSPYYRQALQRLRRHPGAVRLLGEPIKDRGFKLTDPENIFDNQTARLKIPVVGPNGKGTYYFWATNAEGDWKIDRAELELKNELNRRLVVVKHVDSSNNINNIS